MQRIGDEWQLSMLATKALKTKFDYANGEYSHWAPGRFNYTMGVFFRDIDQDKYVESVVSRPYVDKDASRYEYTLKGEPSNIIVQMPEIVTSEPYDVMVTNIPSP